MAMLSVASWPRVQDVVRDVSALIETDKDMPSLDV
jgi:hypothetical protein